MHAEVGEFAGSFPVECFRVGVAKKCEVTAACGAVEPNLFGEEIEWFRKICRGGCTHFSVGQGNVTAEPSKHGVACPTDELTSAAVESSTQSFATTRSLS